MPEYRAKLDAESIAELAQLPKADNKAKADATHAEHTFAANTRRASRAATALVAHADAREELDTSLTDLLADLMHMSDATGLDFDNALRLARDHHNAEILGEL